MPFLQQTTIRQLQSLSVQMKTRQISGTTKQTPKSHIRQKNMETIEVSIGTTTLEQ